MRWCGAVGLVFFSSRRRHTRCGRDWSSDVCSSDLVLASLELVTYQPRPRPERKSWRALLDNKPGGDWHVPGEPVSFRGWPGYCAALARWGPGTRAVLTPWLLACHAQEDSLRAALGRAPRR